MVLAGHSLGGVILFELLRTGLPKLTFTPQVSGPVGASFVNFGFDRFVSRILFSNFVLISFC